MTCEELRDQYELYALGALEAEERTELDTHLGRPDDPCVDGVRRARERMATLALISPEAQPPARLRAKVVNMVGESKRSWNWAAPWAVAMVGLAMVSLWLGVTRREQARILNQMRAEARRKTVELTRLTEAFALMNDPAAKQVVFGENAPKPRGRVFVNPQQGVLLLATNLTPAPSGKIYEMWIIPKGGAPAPAGLFQSQGDGTAMYLRKGAVDMASAAVIAVTLEPEAGSAAPTSTPLIVANL
jgi:anti-sigma-K factor RskA